MGKVGRLNTELEKSGSLIPSACRFWVDVKSYASSLVSFPQYLMTFFEKYAVSILVYKWDSERLKQTPNVT